jgi:hypothetical protein
MKLNKFVADNIIVLKKSFINWLIEIEEDDPLPYEINFVMFVLVKKGVHYEVFFTGHETLFKNTIIAGPYYPLEAQYFNYKNLLDVYAPSAVENLSEQQKDSLALKALNECAKYAKEKFDYLKDRKMYTGFLFDKIKFK